MTDADSPGDAGTQRAVDGLLREIARMPGTGDDERFVARLMGRVRGRAAPARLRLLAVAAGLVAAAGLSAILLFSRPPVESGTQLTADGKPIERGALVAAPDRPIPISLGGACRVKLDAGSALRVEGSDRAEQVFLDRGRLECEVRPGAESFVVRTEIGTVFVKGTRFEVRLEEEEGSAGTGKRLRVEVFEGTVLLTGPSGDQIIEAGESAAVTAQPSPFPAAPSEPVPPAGPPDPELSRLGINFSIAADWVTEYPFVDAFRLSRRWVSQRQKARWGQGPPLDLDEAGWIRRLEPDCWADSSLCTCGHAPRGRYVCLYDGEGDLQVHGARHVILSRPGRIEFETEGGPFLVRIRKTNPVDYVRNIRVIMPGFEERSREDPFHPLFVERWKGFNVFRFMNWMKANSSMARAWEDRPTPAHASWAERGVPLETMADLCNRAGADPWFCMPHAADDDYVRRFARLAKSLLDPGRRVHVEYSNDVGVHPSSGQSRHAADEGLRRRLADAPGEAAWRYAVLRSLEIFAIWEEVFGGTERLVRVLASPADPEEARKRLEYRDASRRVDALAVHCFFRYFVTGRPGADAAKGWTPDDLLDRVEEGPLAEAVRGMPALRAVAEEHGVRLAAASGGQGLQAVGGAERDEAVRHLLRAAIRHPRMGGFYTRLLDAWKAAGGGLFCLYSSTGNWGSGGNWGLLQHPGETESDQPRFRAVMEWNRRNPRE